MTSDVAVSLPSRGRVRLHDKRWCCLAPLPLHHPLTPRSANTYPVLVSLYNGRSALGNPIKIPQRLCKKAPSLLHGEQPPLSPWHKVALEAARDKHLAIKR